MSTTPQPIQPPQPPQKPIKGTRYAIWAIAGVVALLVLLDLFTSLFSTRPSNKQPQRPTGTPPTATSLQGFDSRTTGEADRIGRDRQAFKDAIEKAKAVDWSGFGGNIPACNQAERDKLNGQYFVTQAADGTPVKLVCQTNDQWAIIPPAADSIPPLTPEQQHAVDQYRQQQYGNGGGASPAQSRKDEQRKRREEALNSSSVALDYSHATPQQATIQPVADKHDAVAETHPEQAKEAEGKAAETKKYPWDEAVGPTYKIFEGYILETILTNRLQGEFEGPVDVMVTANVYSRDRQNILIPQGTRILGESKKVSLGNQRRLAVTFHRAIMPDGWSVDFDQYLGLDQQGASGLSGKVDTHWLKGVSTAILVGAIGGLSQGFGYNGGNGGVVVVGSGAASQASQAATQVLERGLNQLPTVTVPEGTRVRVRVGRDFDLPTYGNHRVSPTL